MAAHVKVVPCHSFHSYVYWVTQISQGLNKKRDTNSAHYCDIIVDTLPLYVSLGITTSYIVYWTLYRISDCENERTTRSNVLWFSSLMCLVLLCCPYCSRNHGFMGPGQPQVYERFGIKDLWSNRWKTRQVFPVPKYKHESAKRKCPMCNGNSSSPQKTWRNL